MLVYRGFSHVSPGATVLTIGNFDGIHLGHRALLKRLTDAAKAENLLPTAITFEPHPREYFAPDSAPARLSTLREASRLVVLDRGRVVEVGGHDALMAQEGHYYRLYQAQARNAEQEGGSSDPNTRQDGADEEGERA